MPDQPRNEQGDFMSFERKQEVKQNFFPSKNKKQFIVVPIFKNLIKAGVVVFSHFKVIIDIPIEVLKRGGEYVFRHDKEDEIDKFLK